MRAWITSNAFPVVGHAGFELGDDLTGEEVGVPPVPTGDAVAVALGAAGRVDGSTLVVSPPDPFVVEGLP
jgi:hypothetical protein